MVEHKSLISIDEAVRRIAVASVARNGDEWLGPPTARQLRLIARYVDGTLAPQPYSIMPGFVVGGQHWAKCPADPGLRAEVERALYQRDLYAEQCECALEWLEGRGIDVNAQYVKTDVLLRLIEEFGANTKPSARKVWGAKLGTRLTDSETAVLGALNTLWSNGELDHKARARDRRINDWLANRNTSRLSSRVIQRALQKIKFT